MPDHVDETNAHGNETAETATPAPDGDELNFSQLNDAAKTLIKNSRLGVYGETFVAPFSSQFKATVRGYHSKDSLVYKETDRNESLATEKALAMRVWTFLLYLIFSGAILVMWLDPPNWMKKIDGVYWITLAGFAVVTLFAWLMRRVIRKRRLDEIRNDATDFAIYFFKELSSLHDRAINAVQCSRTDLMMTPSWPDRSAGWIRIALWYGRRYDDLNRYVSAVSWKVGSNYRWIERMATVLKVFVMIVVIVVACLHWKPFSEDRNLPLLVGTALYLLASWLGWGIRPQPNNDYWGEKFRQGIAGFDKQKKHVHNQVAEVVASDKTFFMGGQRNVGKEKGPDNA